MRISKFGFILLIAGILLLLSTYGIFNLEFARDWPWILVIIGVMTIFRFEKRKKYTKIMRNSSKHERMEILEQLKNKEISVEDAAEKLKR